MRTLMKSLLSAFVLMNSPMLLSTQLAAAPVMEDFARGPGISEELAAAINVQIVNEFDGANIYLNMAHHFYLKGLDGFGFWFAQQYYEELNHARILMDFLKLKNVHLQLGTLAAAKSPALEESPNTLFAESLSLEELQSNRIRTLHALAQSSGSVDAAIFLQYFVNEQVQEEDMFQTVVDRLELVRNAPEGILQIDTQLGARLPAVIWMPGQPLP